MNLCFSTLGCSEKSLDEVLALCTQYEIPNLEIRGIGGELDNRLIPDFTAENIAASATKIRTEGVAPLVVGTSCSFHDLNNYDCAIKEGRAAVLTAAALGASAIRVFGNNLGDNPAESTARVIEGINELCTCGAGSGVDILLEVHGDFNTVSALSPVTEKLKGKSNFGLIWDICHTHSTYGEKWPVFYEAFRPFIRHVHIKDVSGGKLVLPGEGEIPIRDIVSRMLADGYKGAFSLEWEKKWHPELQDMEKALNKFKEIML